VDSGVKWKENHELQFRTQIRRIHRPRRMGFRFGQIERENIGHFDYTSITISTGSNTINEKGHTSRSNQSVIIPFPIRTFSNCIDIRGGSLEVVIHHDTSSRVAFDPRRLGELVPRFDPDSVYDKVGFVRSAILECKASEHLGVGAVIGRLRELLGGGTVGEDLDAHPFYFAKDHFACIGVELAREGIRLSVDNADVGDPVSDAPSVLHSLRGE